MPFTPPLTVTRYAKLKPGDLFGFEDLGELCLAMKVVDPAMDGDEATLLLGPSLRTELTYPFLTDRIDATVLSFGQDYRIQAATALGGWMVVEPPQEVTCLVLAEGKIYIRANFRPGGRGSPRHCYVELDSGVVLAHEGRREYAPPPGRAAYAIQWELVSSEERPRTILAFAWARPAHS